MTWAKCFSIFVALALIALEAPAATFYVSPSGTAPYTTISSAMSASAAGDTILVGPGTYNEAVSLASTRRVVIGAGWDVTHVTSVSITSASAAGSVVEGFNATLGTALHMTSLADSVWVRRCRFEATSGVATLYGTRILVEDCLFIEHSSASIVSVGAGQAVVRNCLFVHENGNLVTRFAFSGTNGDLEIYNCVFLGLLRIFSCTGTQPVICINNIVYDWAGAGPAYGTYPAGSVFAYNASDVITPPGTNTILLTANPFVNYDPAQNWSESSDLHLAPGAPVINAGHPDILDLDGSASDLGIYGGPRPLVAHGAPTYPFTVALTISPTLIGVGDTIQVNTSGRVGPRY